MTSFSVGWDFNVPNGGGVTAKHIFLGEQRIATKKSNGTIQFIHSDFVDSSNVITDASGNKTVLLEYDPFGQIVTQIGSVNPRYKYTGQEDDGSTSLFDYNARLYDPQLGRFITADWIILDASNPQNFNRFAYVINNPINYIDPTGHFLDFSNFQPNENVSNYQYIPIDFGPSISNGGFNITPITSQIFITPISDPMETLYTTPIFNPADFGINNLTGFPIAELDPMTFITPIQEALGGMLINQPSIGENNAVLSPIVPQMDFSTVGGGASKKQGARFIADDKGNVVDKIATPPGRYIQPDNSHTDILQQKPHGELDPFTSRTHTHQAIKHVSPENPSLVSFHYKRARPVTFEEVLNIRSGTAKSSKPKGR